MVKLSTAQIQSRFNLVCTLNEVNGDYAHVLESRNVRKFVAVYAFTFYFGNVKIGTAVIDVDPNNEVVIWHEFTPKIKNVSRKVYAPLKKNWATLCHLNALIKLREIRPEIENFDVLIEEESSAWRKNMLRVMGLKREMQFKDHMKTALDYAGKKGFHFSNLTVVKNAIDKIIQLIKNALR